MKSLGVFNLALLSFICVGGCRSTPPAVTHDAYLHFRQEGFWIGVTEIWIFQDDTVCVQATDKRKRSGRADGAFQRLVALVGELKAWQITTSTLVKAREEAERRSGRIGGITDQSQFSVTFMVRSNRVMVASFYAPHFYAREYPEAEQLGSFITVINAISHEVGGR